MFNLFHSLFPIHSEFIDPTGERWIAIDVIRPTPDGKYFVTATRLRDPLPAVIHVVEYDPKQPLPEPIRAEVSVKLKPKTKGKKNV